MEPARARRAECGHRGTARPLPWQRRGPLSSYGCPGPRRRARCASSADIDSLYELIEGVGQKVVNLAEKVSVLDLDRRLDELSSQLAEVLRPPGNR